MTDTTPAEIRSTVDETLERVARAQAGVRWFSSKRNIGRSEWVDTHWREDAELLHMFVATLGFDGHIIVPAEPTEAQKAAAMELDCVKALDAMIQLAFVHGMNLPDGEPPLWQVYRAMTTAHKDTGA